jgi:radical SAM superfamily enzyme YgiQ (UPF0313 family)
VFPYLAALTPEHWEVEINIEIIDEIDYDTDADIIGIGGMGHAMFRGIEIAKEFKKRNKIVVFGGYMASLFSEFVRPYADSIVKGDAEISYPQMLKDFENGTLKDFYDNPLLDMSNLPTPKYELFKNKRIGNALPVQAGRGCPFICKFCSIASLYKGKYMPRDVEDVIRDIKRIKELGYKQFYLVDDNIIGNKPYFRELCKRMIPLKMKWMSQCSLHIAQDLEILELAYKSGCRTLSFGLESINQEGLVKVDKNWIKVAEYKELLDRVSKIGILVSSEMLFGLDGDTTESIKKTYDFVMDVQIPLPKFYLLTPIPGTKLFHEYKEQNRLLHEQYEKYTGTQCVHKIPSISKEELDRMYAWFMNKLFSLPSILKRTIFNRYFFRNPFRYISAFGVNLVYRKYVKQGEMPNIF